jgi:hypothetical protein
VLSIAPIPLAIALGLALLVLLPARRLHLAGISGRWIGVYALFVWGLAFLVAVRPLLLRFAVPILVIAYIAPFVVAPGRITRAIGRTRRGDRGDPPKPPKPPMKNVTPPDEPLQP